jgi:hypothetical protein
VPGASPLELGLNWAASSTETKLKPPMHHLKKYRDIKNLAVRGQGAMLVGYGPEQLSLSDACPLYVVRRTSWPKSGHATKVVHTNCTDYVLLV